MAVKLSTQSLEATILPQYGGMLNSLKHLSARGSTEVIYGYPDTDSIANFIWKDFRNVKLSPFPNRIKDGKYSYAGEDYQLEVTMPAESHAIHGFLLDRPFHVAYQSETELVLHYIYNGKTQGFPFPYQIELSYELVDNELTCETTIINMGKEALPIGDGFHPYFQIGDSINELFFQLPKVELLEIDDRMIPSGEKGSFDNFNKRAKIGNTELDSCFLIKQAPGKASTFLSDGELTLELWQETGDGLYNYLQVYTPPHRKCIALEPMTCPPDALNSKEALIELIPDGEVTFAFGIKLSQ